MTTALERSKALPPDPSLPTLQEELNRKALDAVENLLREYDEGLLTALTLKAATKAIFDTVSGLVDSGIIELISHVAKLPAARSVVVVRKFVRDNKLAVINRSLTGASVEVMIVETDPSKGYGNTVRSFEDELHPQRQAYEYAERVAVRMIESGFEEV